MSGAVKHLLKLQYSVKVTSSYFQLRKFHSGASETAKGQTLGGWRGAKLGSGVPGKGRGSSLLSRGAEPSPLSPGGCETGRDHRGQEAAASTYGMGMGGEFPSASHRGRQARPSPPSQH